MHVCLFIMHILCPQTLKKVWDPVGLELQLVMSCCVVLEIECRFSARAASCF